MTKTKRILLYPAGLPQKEAFVEAKKQGLYIVSVDGDANAELGDMADEFFHVNPGDEEAFSSFVATYHEAHPLSGVLVVGCDLPVSCANAAMITDTPSINVTAAQLTVDKLEMKRLMAASGVAVPEFYEISSAVKLAKIVDSTTARFIVKPNDNCGSRGILQVSPGDDYLSAYKYARDNAKKNGRVIVEKFVPGPQVSIEAIVFDAAVHVTGFADRNYEFFERFAPYIIENGATMPSLLGSEDRAAIVDVFTKGVVSLGLNYCVAKGDMVLGPDGPVVIEIAGRISGGKFASKLVPESTGVNLLEAAIKLAVGDTVALNALAAKYERGVAVRYLFPKPGKVISIDGIAEAKNIPHVIEVVVKPGVGDQVEPITCHVLRGGWVVATGDTRDVAVARAEQAVATIQIHTE